MGAVNTQPNDNINIEELFPKKVIAVVNHFNSCFKEKNGCMHCNDCIAYALITSEVLGLSLPSRGVPYSVERGHVWNFVKFLGSVISLEYLPCPRALPYRQIKDFAWALLRIPIERRRLLRGYIICHTEFRQDVYNKGVSTFR